MSDLIERQSAIDALKEHRALFCDNTPDTFSKLSYGEKCRVDELDTAISTLVNLPSAQTEQSISQERYEDLCEYFKDCSDQGRSILNDRKEFKSWLDRVKWHVMECNKLGRELEKLKTAQPEQQWIPCSERLPKKENWHYWVCTDTGYQCQCRWTNDVYGFGASDRWEWKIFDIPQYQKVVAWMPLPDPYMEEGERK